MSDNYYAYQELREKAFGADATQEDINALGEWFEQHGMRYWNGESYDVGQGYNLYPIYRWDTDLDQGEIIGFTFDSSDQRIYYEDQQERNPVIIPEDPPKNKYRVAIQFPGHADPVVSTTEAVSREELTEAMELFTSVGATILDVKETSEPFSLSKDKSQEITY